MERGTKSLRNKRPPDKLYLKTPHHRDVSSLYLVGTIYLVGSIISSSSSETHCDGDSLSDFGIKGHIDGEHDLYCMIMDICVQTAITITSIISLCGSYRYSNIKYISLFSIISNIQCKVQGCGPHIIGNIIINTGVSQYRVMNAHPYSARNVLDSICIISSKWI